MISKDVKNNGLLNSEAVENPYDNQMHFAMSGEISYAGDINLQDDKGKVNTILEKLFAGIASITGKKEGNSKGCSYRTRISKRSRNITIDCRDCMYESSFEDEHCRKNIFMMLQNEPVIERLTLSRLYERDYEGKTLERIYMMSELEGKLIHYKSSMIISGTCKNPDSCRKVHAGIMDRIIETAGKDPQKTCYFINRLIEYNKVKDTQKDISSECMSCRNRFIQMLCEMREISKIITYNSNRGSAAGQFFDNDASLPEYEKYLRSYVRPPFSTSRIYTEPPDNTIFQECYDIGCHDARNSPVNIYRLTDRPEKMYIIDPAEYSLEETELKVIERVRKKMIVHRPSDLNFADPVNSREYFRRLSKNLLLEEKGVDDIISDPAKVRLCCNLLTKYTTGLGILEDILSDERVTDVYVNAPADQNPVHVVLDGEECITNVYLSQEDMESMVSRLRSISGRPFGEATPVLEMFLREYGVRVSVIGDPLSAKGIAYAFRKHAKDPRTLPKLINNGSISPLAAGLLSFIMDGQASVLVAGGVGAGKTSLMCALLLEIPQKYRMITIEDTPEIPVEELQEMGWKVQGLNSQSAIMKFGIEIEPSVALRASLRLGSSSLVMGEVRGPEVAVLYEAMQVGAAGNSVIGTIHGSSTNAVYERIVNTLGVPPASFKATDAVVVCANTRISGSMTMKRRVMQVSEVNDKWEEGQGKVFSDILSYDASSDSLRPSDIMDRGQSALIGKIADKWGISMDEASLNIRMRAKIKTRIAEYGKKDHKLLEARNVAIANNMFWLLMDIEISNPGGTDYQRVHDRWMEWFDFFSGKKKDIPYIAQEKNVILCPSANFIQCR
ncbi:MAG: type II/IV secretion system ATPase subunit [Methanolobus sp.]|nr:type II/IV secretion system ATPase subunit [Methanolobus sp.]